MHGIWLTERLDMSQANRQAEATNPTPRTREWKASNCSQTMPIGTDRPRHYPGD
jgi:hypothetical protein